MSTLTDVINVQRKEHILYPPQIKTVEEAAAAKTLTIGLVNQSSSSTVYAYVTGLAINNNNAVVLLESDGSTLYYPSNPSSTGAPLAADCSIPLGAPGSTRNVTIPYIAGGRIWFCVDNTLTFLLNPGATGPGLVEPSVSNPSDPNYLKSWDFCEFTVGGLPENGLATVCNGLIAQNAIDGAGWDQLIVKNGNTNLRALNPTQGIVFNPTLFQNYWTPYVNAVWAAYASTPLTVDTQAQWGTITGLTSSDRSLLSFNGVGSFTKPSAADIFGGATGAFAAQPTNTDELLNIGARLDAAFNRSTLLTNPLQPDGEVVSSYYKNPITNHYARIVHAANVDGLGYCFPYDDVTPNGGVNQSGFVNDPSPASLIVAVGGSNAYAQSTLRSQEVTAPTTNQQPLGKVDSKQSPPEEITQPSQSKLEDQNVGSEKLQKPLDESATTKPRKKSSSKLPPVLNRFFGKYFAASRRLLHRKSQSSPSS
ncbi:glucanase b protein [Rutstroemia sp. NJR-2017a BBW]|nr:glucanase b protein [Rutstroemia sp. NJR-2017a BBW]